MVRSTHGIRLACTPLRSIVWAEIAPAPTLSSLESGSQMRRGKYDERNLDELGREER
jgi:hypothetical protein